MTCIQVCAVLFFIAQPVRDNPPADSLRPPPPPSPDSWLLRLPRPGSKNYGWYPSCCHWANNASCAWVQ